jgi:hypothetical protein
MPNESIKSPEPLGEALRALIRELRLININANFNHDGELPALISLDGVIDSTEPGNATDEEIECVVNIMKRDYKNFHFTYDKQGAIAVMPVIN